VHSAADGAAQHEIQAARRHRPVLGQEAAVGQKDARGVIGDGAAVQQLPWLAVCVNCPCADQAGVKKI
jgi:hypothetical protein